MNEGAIIHGGSLRRGETSLHTPASFLPIIILPGSINSSEKKRERDP